MMKNPVYQAKWICVLLAIEIKYNNLSLITSLKYITTLGSYYNNKSVLQ